MPANLTTARFTRLSHHQTGLQDPILRASGLSSKVLPFFRRALAGGIAALGLLLPASADQHLYKYVQPGGEWLQKQGNGGYYWTQLPNLFNILPGPDDVLGVGASMFLTNHTVDGGYLSIGYLAAGGLTSTNSILNGHKLVIGSDFDGTVRMVNSTFTLTDADPLVVGLSGNGTLEIVNNSSLAFPSGQVQLGFAAGKVGRINFGDGVDPNPVGTFAPTTITTGSGAGILEFKHASTFTLNSQITGAITVLQSGTGTTRLTNVGNTYTGGTSITGGTLITNTGAMPAGNVPNAGTLNFEQNTNATFANGISGAGRVVKSGSGTLTFTSVQIYAGGTTVDAGTLVLGTGGPVGTIRGALTINAGATVSLNANNAIGFGNGTKVDTLVINGGTLIAPATDTADQGWGVAYTLNGATMISNNGTNNATASSRFAFGNNTTVTVNGITPSTISGRVDLRADLGVTNVNFTVTDGATLAIPAGISSTAAGGGVTPAPVDLTKLGAGTMILSGPNTYTGRTWVSGGTLVTNTTSTAGLITDNAKLEFAQATDGTYSNAIDGTGAVVKSGAGNLTFSGTQLYTGGTSVEGGTLTLGLPTVTSVGQIRGALTIKNGATVNATTVDVFGFAAGQSITAVTIDGGMLNSTAAGNQGWGITYALKNATMQSNGGTSTSLTASKFAFGNNTSVKVSGGASTISGRIDLRADGGVTTVNFTVDPGATLNVPAAITNISGSVGITKLGSGEMVLGSRENTYAGTTVVNGGKLTITASLSGTSVLTVAGGAELNLPGNAQGGIAVGSVNSFGKVTAATNTTFLGALQMGSGGELTIAKGQSEVQGALSLAAGSTWHATLTDTFLGAYSQLLTKSTITIAGALDINLAPGYTPTMGSKFFLVSNSFQNAPISPGFSNVAPLSATTGTFIDEGITYLVNYADSSPIDGGNNDLSITVIPEPTATLLLALCGVALATRRRRLAPIFGTTLR